MSAPSASPRSPASPASTGKRARWLALLLFLGTLGLFSGVRDNDFVLYDDDVYVLENPLVADGLTASAVGRAFSESKSGNWHPLTWLSHALDVELYGLEPAGHHITSLLLHALSAVLLFVLARRCGAGDAAAFFLAALFAWHPLRVESVAWVAERKDVLSGALGLATLIAYVDWTRSRTRSRLVLACTLFALGLMAKSMLVTWPLLFCVLDRWPLERTRLGLTASLREKLPFFVLAAVAAAAALTTQSGEGTTATLETLPLGARVANAFVAAGTYATQTLFPFGLAVFYPHPAVLGDAQLVRGALWAAAFTGAFIVAWRARERTPWAWTGLAWFALTLLPVIGLVQIGMQAHADRYTYLPSIGLGLCLVGAASAFRRHAAVGVGAAFLFACAGRTWSQVAVWRDTETLFRHATEVTENNWVAYRNLATSYEARGEVELAREALEAELAVGFHAVEVRAKLGELAFTAGDLEGALEHYRALALLLPADGGVDLDLANVHLARGDLDAAEVALDVAAGKGLDSAALAFTRGYVAQSRGDSAGAEAAYRSALEHDPALADAWNNLGEVQLASARPDDAVASFRALVALAPGDAFAHFNLGVALERAGDRAAARAAYAAAARLAPEFAPARERLDALGGGDG